MRFWILALLSVSMVTWATEEPEPTLIGGDAANARDWPASVYASMGNSRCSATVVGQRTVFIAAHCVSNGGSITFSVLSNRYTGRCTQSPNYRNNATADWSLCLIDRVVDGIEYEKVNLDPSILKMGDELTLTGYGCIRSGGTGGNDGIYRVGKAKITSLPSGSSNDIVTRGGAALCYGDSGGPAFQYPNGGTDRYLVSINSRGNISTTSYLSSTSTSMATSFIRSWMDTNQQVICGISTNAANCRGGSAPSPESSFTLENRLLTLNGKMKAGKESALPDVRDALDWVMRNLSLTLE